jgi:hypothetical protein
MLVPTGMLVHGVMHMLESALCIYIAADACCVRNGMLVRCFLDLLRSVPGGGLPEREASECSACACAPASKEAVTMRQHNARQCTSQFQVLSMPVIRARSQEATRTCVIRHYVVSGDQASLS